ncbi:branched-chain amino acid ABC transporter permease [Candidatus Peregrinibacteria bacterium]|nr:branched-chain amino acid ABC transporter permease [Candidatus Peregrinibacteria bacterium]
MLEILPQIIWFSLLASAIYALVAIGLSLIFGILEFINFAQGDFAMVGAYLFFGFVIEGGLPWWVGIAMVVIIAALMGVVIERITFKPVRKSPPFIPLVISIGVGALLQAIMIFKFGGSVKSYRIEGSKAEVYKLFGDTLNVTQSQITLMLVTAGLLLGLYLFLKYSKTGTAIRAVADNQDVAAILGVSINKTIGIIFAVGTALAAIAGVLIANEQNLSITMGLSLGVKAFAAVVLGGVGSLPGAIVGAFIIGFSENFIVGLTSIPSSYKDAIVFGLLIIMLFLYPNGLFGAKAEEEARA